MKHWHFLLLALVVVVLAACNDSEKTTDVDGNEGNDESEVSDVVLVYGRGTDSVSLDPATVTDGESFKVARNIYEIR